MNREPSDRIVVECERGGQQPRAGMIAETVSSDPAGWHDGRPSTFTQNASAARVLKVAANERD
jgi:hypothetical protein